MKEMSNSTLALLVVSAIVVSVFGTLMSINRLNLLTGGAGVTGFATTATGTANLSVSASAAISFSDSLIEIGTLLPNQTNSSDDKNDWWRVLNDGGVNVSIEVYATSQGSGTYLNNRGLGPFSTSTASTSGCIVPSTFVHTCFKIKCNSTATGLQCNNTYYPLWNQTGQNIMLIDLSYVDGSDYAVFGVNVTVPISEPSGNKQQQVTFLGASSD